MYGLARMKAIEASLSSQHGGWAVAQHMEIAPSQDSGLVTGRDRGLAARDHRDSLRALSRQSGGGHQGRRGGNS